MAMKGIFFLDNEDLSYAFYLSDNGGVKPYDLGDARVLFSPNLKYWCIERSGNTHILYRECRAEQNSALCRL
jgi:hypothetical protein